MTYLSFSAYSVEIWNSGQPMGSFDGNTSDANNSRLFPVVILFSTFFLDPLNILGNHNLDCRIHYFQDSMSFLSLFLEISRERIVVDQMSVFTLLKGNIFL